MQKEVCLLESKTFSKLFSQEFKPKNRKTVEGFPITTVIDKVTNKPVEVYFKKSPRNLEKNGEVEVPIEEWELFRKTPKGKEERLGFIHWTLEKDSKTFGVGFIGNQIEYDKYYTCKLAENTESQYAGIGIRLNQIKIERFLQEKFNTIKILSTGTAYPFHAKNGFKVSDKIISLKKISASAYDNFIEKLKGIISLDEKSIKSILDKYTIKNSEEYLLSLECTNELFPLSYLKTGTRDFGDTPMILPEESLEFWKSLIHRQPILE